jgi:hypothetical protein
MEPDAPISGRSPRVQTFACRAAPVGLGSQLPFAAIRLNVRFADRADRWVHGHQGQLYRLFAKGLRTDCEHTGQAGPVELLEGCKGVFQTFVYVRFQRLGGNVDIAGKCRFKYLAMFLNCLFATISQDEHLVA